MACSDVPLKAGRAWLILWCGLTDQKECKGHNKVPFAFKYIHHINN
jgi:hypothetical protein